ncbi:hypothetical protein GPECTOR_33g582 [Gonium pectorale]|uniref:BZIP domain-containing protein n=1 Tax=Gonium pectorale TaxID=33097 RepID=A0A150GEC3_GONPE|nr:hypothetical protein GPECTOR_33g582 [Gonium pectorale]|eukprot:KXZ47700.1 hypothetical protein GPECTOR_33g582 [Gonium pectorale]
MEELGLGLGDSPLASLSSDLASYLDGSNFAGLDQQTFLGSFAGGELDALAGRLDVPQDFSEAQASHQEHEQPRPAATHDTELPTTSGAAVFSNDDEDDETGGRPSGAKRRRRTRTERQQVLNRLAQQRYRQRKKEKVQALQSTVGTLQSQLDRLSFLESENTELRATTAALSSQLAAKDAAIVTMQTQLRAACGQLKAQADKAAAAERLVAEQAATLESQRQQLRASSLAGLDPQALSDRLLGIIKEALAGAEGGGSAGGADPAAAGAAAGSSGGGSSGLLSDEVVTRISRTLTSCCRELVYATKQVGKQVPQAEAAAPSAIPVSCC